MSTRSDSDGSFGEWDDADEDLPVTSFLGAHPLPSASAAWAELQSATGVDIPALAASLRWDAYALVRIVNTLRAAGAHAAAAGSDVRAALAAAVAPDAIAPGAPLWADDAALLPVLVDDALLMAVATGNATGADDGADGDGTDGADDAATIRELRAELARARALVLRLTSSATDGAGGGADGGSSSGAESEGGNDDGGGGGGGGGGVLGGGISNVGVGGDQFRSATRGFDVHSYYFDSYGSNTGIHRTMLADAPRTNAYRDALTNGSMKGLRVLDLGSGTGVLSLFAAKDAAAVVALDASSVVDDCASIIRANGAAGRIAVVYGRAEDVPLSRIKTADEAIAGRDEPSPAAGRGFAVLVGAVEPEADAVDAPCFDAIVSEWMGYGLLYESMLASVITARDRYLRPGGLMLPSVASLFAGLVSSAELWAEKVRAPIGFGWSAFPR
jgi:SAM-dependent methyltransferase